MMSDCIDKNFTECLKKSELIILSIVIVSRGLINNNDETVSFDESNKVVSCDNIILLNISHTDSYLQNLTNKYDSLYNQLGAKFIFPIEIWKNDIKKTLNSTGNINRRIYNLINLYKMKKFKLNVMIDNIKQNIPKHNYIVSSDLVNYFSEICEQFNLDRVYFSEWFETIKSNNIEKLIKFIKFKYNIEPFVITDTDFSLNKKQINYYRQNIIGKIKKYNY